MTEPTISPEWEDEIAWAQGLEHLVVAGELRKRVAYGSEPGLQGANLKPRCYDCAARLGELHVPNCCGEVCPKCAGQLVTCGCEFHEGPHRDDAIH